jgi:hypothetical protein
MNEVIELIRHLVRERFYGAVTIKFEAGNVVCLKNEETIKTANLSGKPRSQNEPTTK